MSITYCWIIAGVSSVGEGSWSRTAVPPWLGLPVGDRIVVSACHYVSGPAQARVVAAPPAGPGFAGKRVYWGPWVYEHDTMLKFHSFRDERSTIQYFQEFKFFFCDIVAIFWLLQYENKNP